jgi:hypothetical protein
VPARTRAARHNLDRQASRCLTPVSATPEYCAEVDIDHLLPGIVGAFVGVVGWLLVGLFIQRRQFVRQARNAARAVYFEIDMNRLCVEVALAHGSFASLSRSSFERLLPELATLLSAADLRTIVEAYLGHAGYQQMSTDTGLPPAIRRQALTGLLSAQSDAMARLAARAFSDTEARALAHVGTQPAQATALAEPSAATERH